MGRSLHFGDVRVESAIHLIATTVEATRMAMKDVLLAKNWRANAAQPPRMRPSRACSSVEVVSPLNGRSV